MNEGDRQDERDELQVTHRLKSNFWPSWKDVVNHLRCCSSLSVGSKVLSPAFWGFFFSSSLPLSLKQWLEFKEERLWSSQDDKTGLVWCRAQLNQCQPSLQPGRRASVTFHNLCAAKALKQRGCTSWMTTETEGSLDSAPAQTELAANERKLEFTAWVSDEMINAF